MRRYAGMQLNPIDAPTGSSHGEGARAPIINRDMTSYSASLFVLFILISCNCHPAKRQKALKLRDLNPIDTTWSAFNNY